MRSQFTGSKGLCNPELGSHHSTTGNNNGITYFRSEGGGSHRRFSEEVRFNQDLKDEEEHITHSRGEYGIPILCIGTRRKALLTERPSYVKAPKAAELTVL